MNPFYFLYLCKKSSVMTALNDPTTTLTQAEAHAKLEMPIWDPAFSFAGMINSLYTVIFFQPLLPLSGVIGVVIFFLMYWSHKHRFLRMSVKPVTISDHISLATLYLISLGVMIYGVNSSSSDEFDDL